MDTMQLSKDIWNKLSDNVDNLKDSIPFGDFVTHSDRILKTTEIDENKDIKENSLEIARKLYDELDRVMNFHSILDFAVKNLFLPVIADVLEEFFTNNLFKN